VSERVTQTCSFDRTTDSQLVTIVAGLHVFWCLPISPNPRVRVGVRVGIRVWVRVRVMVRVEVRVVVRVGVRVGVRVRFGVGGRVRVMLCVTSRYIIRTSVSNNFVQIRRIGIRRNGIRRNGAKTFFSTASVARKNFQWRKCACGRGRQRRRKRDIFFPTTGENLGGAREVRRTYRPSRTFGLGSVVSRKRFGQIGTCKRTLMLYGSEGNRRPDIK